MLRDDMEQYTKLTGKDATNVPIIKLGAYLDGYDKGIEVLDKIRAEIEEIAKPNEFGGRGNGKSVRYGLCKALEIIDKYKVEGSESDGNND